MTQTTHVADRLIDAVARCRAPVCVGIDPVVDRLPASVLESHRDPAEAIGVFGIGVIESVAPHVPCVKIQSACFERYGPSGIAALDDVLAAARAVGLVAILDAKRGDIGISAEHYAAAAFGGPNPCDWITVNAYLGADGIEPFLAVGGAFALVRTSNPGGDAVQETALADGRTIAERMAEIVAEIGDRHVGTRGFSALGAVVGATRPDAARRLRAAMPRQILLVPGFGAQGAGVDDILPCFNADGRGAIVTASRSVIFAADRHDPGWRTAVGDAAAELAEQIGVAVGWRP